MKRIILSFFLLGLCCISSDVLSYSCSKHLSWNSSQAYVGGDIVQHQQKAYQAIWWTQGDNPEQNSEQWQVWNIVDSCESSDSSGNAIWVPSLQTTWQWQLSGAINVDYNADVYDIDLFDTPTTTINHLHANGKKVVCYFSAGSYEEWRNDAGNFSISDLGNTLDDWPGERWLDVRSTNVRSIMASRIQLAKDKGCDAVEPDNIDGYTNNPGFNFTAQDQLNFNKYLAEQAHVRGLSIGLKNNLDQVQELVDDFDFAVNEQCFEYSECDRLYPFTAQSKAVFNAEYSQLLVDDTAAREALCQNSRNKQFSTLILPLELNDAFRFNCLDESIKESTFKTDYFVQSDKLFTNPERGWIVHRFSHAMGDLSNLRESNEKVSLVLIKVDIGAYKNVDHLAQSKLNEIRQALQMCRDTGVKAIMRSAYAWEEQLAPDPTEINRLVNHVNDMSTIYNDYKDVIVAIEMGMFGPWGEMHSSAHSTNNTALYYPIKTDALRTLHTAYMNAMPEDRQLIVRRPFYIREIFGDTAPLNEIDAYSGTAKSRTGFHNDAYLFNDDDGGTFAHGWNRQQELDYIHAMSQFTFFGGEAFGTPNGTHNNATNALSESRYQHLSYLNRDYYTPIYDAWGIAKDEFTRNMGYRFVLNNVRYTGAVAPGGVLDISINLQNVGFANLHNPRPVELILSNGSQSITTQTSLNPRNWRTGQNARHIQRKFHIPSALAEGEWQVLISLPDANVNAHDDPRYAVRFANENVWNGNGSNALFTFIVDKTAAGTSDNNNNFFEIGHTTPTPQPTHVASIQNNQLQLTTQFSMNLPYRQVFIDTDNTSSTGFHSNGIGADYLIENNNLYLHNGSGWSWSFINNVNMTTDNLQYSWSLPVTSFSGEVQVGDQLIFAESNGTDISLNSETIDIQ